MADYYALNADKSVSPIDNTLDWAKAYEDREGRRVGLTELDGARVSTVFLGLNHAFDPLGPPMIFETMVFPPDSSSDVFCERYSTYAKAEAGHVRAVALVKDHLAAGKPLSEMPYSFED